MLNFILLILSKMQKKVKKSQVGCCGEEKRWYLCNPKRTKKVRLERMGRFGSSLKEWNGCSKQLEDFFEAQR